MRYDYRREMYKDIEMSDMIDSIMEEDENE